MRLLVRVNGTPAYIVGYGPGANGSPRAICVIEGVLRDFALSEIELTSVPRRLQKLKKKHQAKAALAVVVNSK